MKEYDSILKEKKTYQDPVIHHSKYTKYVLIYILLLIIIVGISYVIYYRKVLSPSNIFFYDINTFLEKYQSIVSHAIPENIEELNNLEGTIVLNDSKYSYGFSKEEESIKIELAREEEYFTYYQNNQTQYIQISSLPEQKIERSNITIESPKNIKTMTRNYLKDEKFIKNFYLENQTPIVEINLVLNTTDINHLLGTTIQNQYEVMVTLKNHAITGQPIHSKIIVNNKTKNDRSVYTYDNEKIEYTTNDGKKYKFTLSTEGEDFNLKIYQEEELYSIFLGKKLEKTYQYTYQVIDKFYNITLNFTQENKSYQYELTSNIEENQIKNEQSLKVIFQKKEDILLEENNPQIINYNNLSQEEKEIYQEFLKTFFLPFREFIDKY